jgi:hypothetical protein
MITTQIFRRKPPQGTLIDWTHPLTKDLIGAIIFNERGGNRIYNAAGYENGPYNKIGADWDPSKEFPTFNGNQDTNVKFLEPHRFHIERTDKVSILIDCTINDLTRNQEHALIGDIDAANSYRGWYVRNSYQLFSGDYISFFLCNTWDTNVLEVHGDTNLNSAQRYQFGVTYDGSSAASGVKLYVDGRLESNTVWKDTLSATSTTTNNCKISGRNDNVSNHSGKIYSIFMWKNRILTQDEIRNFYADPDKSPFRIFLSHRAQWRANVFAQTISPAAPIPTHLSWPTPALSILTVIPAAPAIPAHRSWLSPTVAGPISAATIPQHRAWLNATVTGPITLAASIPAHRSWPTPSLNVEQRITPSGVAIPTHASWPTLTRVANTLTIALAAGIPTHKSWPSPVVSGSALYINVVGIAARRSWRFPTVSTPAGAVVGGAPDVSLSLFIGGSDRTQYLAVLGASDTAGVGGGGGGASPSELAIESQTIGRWHAKFDLYDGGGVYAPALAQTVMIQEAGRRLFAGCIWEISVERFLSTADKIVYHCTAVDKSGICDHRVVTARTYTSGTTVQSVILDIVATCLNGEGITANSVPSDLGSLTSDLPLNFTSVTNAFDQIATLSGTVWWVDALSDLHFSALLNLPTAPFALTETSRNWRGLTMQQTLLDYRNRQYAVSNLNTLPGATASPGGGGGGSNQAVTETFVWSVGSPGINSGIYTPTGATVPLSLNVSLPISRVVSMTAAGVAQTTVNFANYSGQTATSGNDYLWFYAGSGVASPGQTLSPSLGTGGGPGPATAAAISVTYVPASPSAAVLAQPALVASPAEGAPFAGTIGTCGSGIYEAVEQVKDITHYSDLTAIAQAVLNRRGAVPTVIGFETDQTGLEPGQKLSVTLPLTYVPSGSFMVTSVRGVWLGRDLGFGSGFRWRVRCQNNEDPGNWVKWYERLLARTENPFPVYQYEIASFVLAAGSSLSAGTAETNPYIVHRTGQLVDMYAAAHVPPTGQDLILYAYLNGAQLPGSVTIPAGSSPDVEYRFTFPASPPYYVFARPTGPNDIITVASQYRTTSGALAPAGSISFDVRWRM